jgi:polyhydroxyalkanoate synthesis regulator phasin
MAASKTTSDSKKKRVSKAKTRFYVVKKVQKTQADLTSKLEDYNRKYITQPLETGKTFVGDLKAEPRKTVGKLIDDGKAQITDLKKDACNRVDGFGKDGRALLTKASKNPRETFKDLVGDGRGFVEGIRNDTRNKLQSLKDEFKMIKRGVEKDAGMVMADVIDGSKKALNQVPGKQRIEKEISSRMEAIPAKFNLPSKKDIDGLVNRVKRLNAKVDALNKTQAA